MTLFQRIASCFLMASALGLAGCPVGMDRRDGRDDRQSSDQGRHDDGHDHDHDHDRHSDDNRPR